MPSRDNHLQTAQENFAIVRSMILANTPPLAWSTTITFYTALHLVEACFAVDNIHAESHDARHNYLKRTTKYQAIWRNYQPLLTFSLTCRYLSDENGSAEQLAQRHLGVAGVREKVIGHYLRRIDRSVAGQLQVNSILDFSFLSPASASAKTSSQVPGNTQ